MPSLADPQTDRIVGCFLAGAIGDAWGSVYEGSAPPVELKDDIGWILTDDTQLTLATCEAIVKSGGVDPSTIGDHFAQAFRAGGLVGLGASTFQSLQGLSAGGHWALVGRNGERAAGNGAAMRAAPLAFCLDPDVPSDRILIRDVCQITHHSDEAYIGGLAVIRAIRRAWHGLWPGGPGLISSIVGGLPDSNVRDRLDELGRLNPQEPLIDVARRFGNSGYVVESVPFALFAAQQAHVSTFDGWLKTII